MELPKDEIDSVAVPGLFMARHRVGVNSMAHFTGACMLHLAKMSALPLIWMTDLSCLHVSNLVFQDITITHWTIRSHFVWSERVCNPWRLFVMYMFRNSNNYTEKRKYLLEVHGQQCILIYLFVSQGMCWVPSKLSTMKTFSCLCGEGNIIPATCILRCNTTWENHNNQWLYYVAENM